MAILRCTNGTEVQIDDSDYEACMAYRWYAHIMDRRSSRTIKRPYVYTSMRDPKTGKGRTVYLHRFLMKPRRAETVDHINGDTLDNRRSNLRIATRSDQNKNKGVQSNNTSGFKGVSWNRSEQKFEAYIHIPPRRKRRLGYYRDAETAARAYDRAAREIYGAFALTNFPE